LPWKKKFEALPKDAEKIYQYLIANGGSSPVHDKTEPHIIYDVFGLSKGAFKRGIGFLYRQKRIEINDDGIVIVEN